MNVKETIHFTFKIREEQYKRAYYIAKFSKQKEFHKIILKHKNY